MNNFTGRLSKSFKIDPAVLTVYPKGGQSAAYGITEENLMNLGISYVIKGAAENYSPVFSGKLKVDFPESNLDAEGFPMVSSAADGIEYRIVNDSLALSASEIVNRNYILNYDSTQNNEFIIYEFTDSSAVASLYGTIGLDGWYTSEITLTPPEGYIIRRGSSSGGFGQKVLINDNKVYSKDDPFTYVLRNDLNDAILQPKTITFKQDTKKPVVQRSNTEPSAPVQQEEIIVTLDNLGPASLKESGNIILQMKTSALSSSWQTLSPIAGSDYTYSYTAQSNGTYSFKAINAAGIESEILAINVTKIDTTKPNIKVELKDSDGDPYINDSWTNKDITITLGNYEQNLGDTAFWCQKVVTTPEGDEVSEGKWEIIYSGTSSHSFTHKIEENVNSNTVTYRIKLVSASGMESDILPISIRGNTVLPALSIKINDSLSWDTLQADYSFNTFFTSAQTFKITSSHPVSSVPISSTSFYIMESTDSGAMDTPPTSPEEIEKKAKWVSGTSAALGTNKKYIIYAKATDASGNTSYVSTEGLVIDSAGPTFSASYPYNSVWTYDTENVKNTAIEVKNVADNLSGVQSTFYKIAKSKSELESSELLPLTVKDNIAQIEFENGESFVQIFAQDNAGNLSSSDIFSVKKDQIVPSISVDVDDSTYQPFKTALITTSVGASGIKQVRVKEKNALEWTVLLPESENSYKYTINDNGTYVFEIENNAGNSSNTEVEITKVDKGRPAVEVSAYLNSNLSTPYTSNTWTNQDVLIRFKNITEGIVISKYEYKINDEAWQTSTPDSEGLCALPIVTDDGEYTFTFKITSSENQVSDEITFIVKRNTQTPSGKLTLGEYEWDAITTSNSENNIFYKEAQKAEIVETSAVSGIANTEYFIKSGDENEKISVSADSPNAIETEVGAQWQTGDLPDLTPNKQYIIYAKITDNAGNRLYISTDIITIDGSLPEFTVNYQTKGWTTKAVITIENITDNLSGIKRMLYKIDEEEPEEIPVEDFTNPITIDYLEDGYYNIKFIMEDNAGNLAESTPFIVRQDSAKPPLQVEYDDSYPELTKDISIISDGGLSGVKSVEVLEPGESEWKTIELTPVIVYTATANGEYRFRITNNAGTVSDECSVTLTNVEAKKPVLDLALNMDSSSEIYIPDTWTNKDINITLSESSGSPVANKFYYKINDGEYKEIVADENGKYIVKDQLKDGVYIYTFKIVNELGLSSEEKSFIYKKDATPPEAKISSSDSEWSTINSDISFNTYFNSTQKIRISGEDNTTSGLLPDIPENNINLITRDSLLPDETGDNISSEPSTAQETDNNEEDTENNEDSSQAEIEKIEYFILTGEELEKVKDNLPKTDEEIEALVNGRWQEGEATDLDPGGKYIVYAKVTDKAGNVKYANTDGIVIDDQNPQINIIYPYDGIWTPKATVVIENISDDISGIKSARYIIDDGEAQDIDLSKESITLDSFTDGSHTLYAEVEDNSGNVNSTGKISIKQDSVKPFLRIQANDTQYETEKEVIILPSVGYSGVKSVEVQAGNGDSGNWETINLDEDSGLYKYMAQTNGSYKFRVQSNAGLFSDELSQTFEKIDPPIYADSNTTSNFLKEGDLKSSFYTALIALVVSSTLAMIYVAKRGRGKGKRKKKKI